MPTSSSDRRRRFGNELGNERGVALFVVAALLVVTMGLVGLSIDLGRGYLVRATLGAAVDAAALAAARTFPAGTTAARAAADKIFNANFPPGFLGVTSVTNPPNVTFSTASDGSTLIDVSSQAVLPTTFIRVLALLPGAPNLNDINLGSAGQATRRLVDMAFVIDRSGSLGGAFPAVRTASSNFIGLFDTNLDRIALISFSNNTLVHDPITTPARGFSLGNLQGHIAALTQAGATSTAEGLYQAWNQLRRIPVDNQSGLRAVVLFTDGAPNSFPARFETLTNSGIAVGCNNNVPVPAGTFTTNVTGTLTCGDPQPGIPTDTQGLWDTYDLTNWNDRVLPTGGNTNWQSPTSVNFTLVNPCIPRIPPASLHAPQGGNGGLPTSFPIFDGSVPAQLPLINQEGVAFRNHVQNANNAARNLAQSIAYHIRNDDTGQAPIHIFALGLGDLLNQPTGADLETGSHMLRRLTNDPTSPSYDSSEPEGAYFFAGAPAQLDAAFQAIRDRIIRISE